MILALSNATVSSPPTIQLQLINTEKKWLQQTNLGQWLPVIVTQCHSMVRQSKETLKQQNSHSRVS